MLDEPSIGLHQRDNERLLGTLIHLRDLGNTVIVVEHDEDAIRAADHVIDIGPGAGVHGGEVVAEGPLEAIMAVPESLTGQYMSGKRKIEVPKKRVPANPEKVLKLTGARGNNLKDVTLTLPVGLFTCITGVSGSGKSTLINDTLFPIAQRQLNGATIAEPAPYRDIQGLEHFDKVIDIDQSPIGRTPRSNPATYTGVFTPVRELFAGVPESRARGYTPGRFSFNVRGGRCEACQGPIGRTPRSNPATYTGVFTPVRELFAGVPESRARGYTPGRFSFNVRGGRCEACQGDGVIKVEMHFLPDIYVPCDQCKGKRYNRETLEIKYKGKTIHEVLDMTIEEAREFFDAVPALARKLQTLMDVGLTYIRLGQSATTLSGGEAQRVKLARELSKRGTGQTLYILDEPTTGLHFADIQQLLDVLHKLRDQGNTIVVIEHNLDVIKTADWIVDLGPEGGSGGGEILVSGTPPDIYVPCDQCKGKRYNRETLEIKYKGKTIHEVLDMTIEEAREFFDAVPALARKLQTLMDVGLTYIRLGQSATTLSGGEAQRVKLARELSKRGTGQTLYILDEPTTGLHFADIQQLLDVLHKLRDQGNTIVVIEHNLDVIKTADWIVDLGPEGGSGGGEILVSGTPETVAECEASHTARFLKPML